MHLHITILSFYLADIFSYIYKTQTFIFFWANIHQILVADTVA